MTWPKVVFWRFLINDDMVIILCQISKEDIRIFQTVFTMHFPLGLGDDLLCFQCFEQLGPDDTNRFLYMKYYCMLYSMQVLEKVTYLKVHILEFIWKTDVYLLKLCAFLINFVCVYLQSFSSAFMQMSVLWNMYFISFEQRSIISFKSSYALLLYAVLSSVFLLHIK